jgi:hypothetical protein
MTNQEIKKEAEQKRDIILKECRLFWAFSNDQLNEGIKKINLLDGEKIVHMGHGGYLPKANVDKFLNGMEAIKKWEKEERKAQKYNEREKHILGELRNYECFYVGDIQDALPALLPFYTKELIQKVFTENYGSELEAIS